MGRDVYLVCLFDPTVNGGRVPVKVCIADEGLCAEHDLVDLEEGVVHTLEAHVPLHYDRILHTPTVGAITDTAADAHSRLLLPVVEEVGEASVAER
jgi:hypothetical protein